MKKSIAVLLSLSMILGLAACTGKTEETKKKKKKTKKTTEITATTLEPTDDTLLTDDTAPTTDEPTDTTEAPTETTAPKADKLVISHDLDAVTITGDRYFRVYGALDSQGYDEYTQYLNYVRVDGEVADVYIEHDEPQNVQDILQKIDDETYNALLDFSYRFNTEAGDLYYKEKNGDVLFDYSFTNNIEFYRTDTKIISYVEERYEYKSDSTDDSFPEYISHNYNVEEVCPIRLTDVVTDLPALAQYVQENFDDDYVLDDILVEIENGTAPFGILYDGIFLYSVNGKIPALGNESMFDMSYFGATPEYYTMFLNKYNSLTWDFDGDGELDELYVQQAGSDHLFIHYDGAEFDFFPDQIPDLQDVYTLEDYATQYVLFADSGCYLFLTLIGDDDYSDLLIFELADGKVEFKNSYQVWIGEIHDPNFIKVGGYESVLGFTASQMRCALNDGELVPYYVLGDVYCGAYKLNVALKGKEFDRFTMDVGDDITIPKGACVTIAYYAGGSGDMVIRVLDPDDLKQYDVLVETDGKSKIAGKDVNDVLTGIHWAG